MNKRYIIITTLFFGTLILTGVSCPALQGQQEDESGDAMMAEPITRSGTDGGVPYTYSLVRNCDLQTFEYKRIGADAEGRRKGIDVGVFMDENGQCGVWQFEFVVGALLANVDPEIDRTSFALVRDDGGVINIAALSYTTDWVLQSQEGGTMGEWLGLEAVQARTGDIVDAVFVNQSNGYLAAVRFDFTVPGQVTVDLLSS